MEQLEKFKFKLLPKWEPNSPKNRGNKNLHAFTVTLCVIDTFLVTKYKTEM